MRISRNCPSLPRALRPRFGFRTFIVSLAAVYFTAMYVFHSGLNGGAPPSHDRDEPPPVRRWAAGGEHQGAEETHRRRPVDRLDDDMQAAFDYIQRMEQARREGGGSEVFKVPRHGANDTAAGRGGQPTDDVNRPASCNSTATEQRRRRGAEFQQLGAITYLLSAFWDQRPNDFDNQHNGTLMRIVAVLREGVRPVLECDFGSSQTPVSLYEMCENHHRAYGSYILSCHVPDDVLDAPCFITVTDKSSSVSVPVRTLRPQTPTYTFSVCVPPLFGDVAPSKLVEFFELTFILGAEQIVIYDFKTSPATHAVVQHYNSRRCRGVQRCHVELINWTLPDHVAAGIWYNGQSLAIQDCLYGQMASSRYVVFADIDEFIVPHRDGLFNWAELVQSLEKPTHCAYQFASGFFDPMRSCVAPSAALPPGDGDSQRHGLSAFPDLLTMRCTQRSQHLSKIRTKCMVEPYKIFEAGIHHISKPIWAHLRVERVDEKLAVIHHYRTCVGTYGMNCFGTVEDSTILRYHDQLVPATASAWKELVDVIL